jgi:DNA-directed RNA polymerase specialized sigma24 family protein
MDEKQADKPALTPEELSDLPATRIRQIYLAMVHKAIKLGYWREAEDIGQEVMLKLASGRSHHTNNEWLVIDVLREKYSGRKGNRNYQSKKNLLLDSKEFKAHHAPQTPEFSSNVSLWISYLRGQERAILILYSLWGLSCIEIAHCFGESCASISQKMNLIINKIEKGLLGERPKAPKNWAFGAKKNNDRDWQD